MFICDKSWNPKPHYRADKRQHQALIPRRVLANSSPRRHTLLVSLNIQFNIIILSLLGISSCLFSLFTRVNHSVRATCLAPMPSSFIWLPLCEEFSMVYGVLRNDILRTCSWTPSSSDRLLEWNVKIHRSNHNSYALICEAGRWRNAPLSGSKVYCTYICNPTRYTVFDD